MNLTAAFNILTGLGLGIVFTKLGGYVRAWRRENQEIEARAYGRQWGGRL